MNRPAMLLLVGSVLGLAGCDAEPDSDLVSFRCAPGGGAAVVGLADLKVNGNAQVLAGSDESDIFSNGNVELMGDIVIQGDVVAGGNVTQSGYAINISGEAMSEAGTISVSVPYEEATAAMTTNDNASIPAPYMTGTKLVLKNNETLTLAAGTYYFSEINISGQARLDIAGEVDIYVDGPVKISGGAHTVSSDHWDFNLYSISSEPVSFSGNTTAAMNIYAPLADVKISGNENISGTVLGKLVTLSGFAVVTTAGDAASFGKSCVPSQPD